MDRITKDHLNYKLEQIQRLTGKTFNIGYAYGGVRLEANGGSKDISGRVTKRELYDQLATCVNILEHSAR